MRVVIAAGGTAGHVMPALAVADALRRRGAEVSFIGVRNRVGSELIAAHGYPEDRIRLRGLARRVTPANIVALGLAATALPKAMRALRKRRAEVVIAAGGYVGGPVAVAAWLTRRPLMLTEADSHLGLANRIVAPFAKRVALAFPLAGRSGKKYFVTGRPVSDEVRSATRVAGRRALGIAPEATCVLIAGGSQGARTLNQAALDAFGNDPPIDILHVAGPDNVDDVRRELERGRPGTRYRLMGFLDNFHDAIAAADLVVSRSGGSVFEIAAIGRPAILVPYPYATNDHQAKNARWMADAGAAVVLPDDECDGDRLRSLVGALLSDRAGLAAMADAARVVGRPESADLIADAALALVKA